MKEFIKYINKFHRSKLDEVYSMFDGGIYTIEDYANDWYSKGIERSNAVYAWILVCYLRDLRFRSVKPLEPFKNECQSNADKLTKLIAEAVEFL